MKKISRALIATASLSLVITWFVPFWFIHLTAPQYPEGLTMQIWPYKLTGEVGIINQLNHYIGMGKISEEMFPELRFMVYIIGIYIALGLLVSFSGRLKFLGIYIILILAGIVAALADMYRWGYEYGHELDPSAPIRVPGLSYQPPLIGHKQLLNFDAYSYPDTGGWIFIAATLILVSVWFCEWRRARKSRLTQTAGIIVLCSLLHGCSPGPQKIHYGSDQCEECKMTIMDPKFAAEVITRKGKVYKFDDLHCVVNFLKSGKVPAKDTGQTVFVDYHDESSFLDAGTAIFVRSTRLKSPMNSNTAAFANSRLAEEKAKETGGEILDWNSVRR